MERKEFIKSFAYACVGGLAITTLIQSCASENYYAKSFEKVKQIIIKKSEFVYFEDNVQKMRTYVLINTYYNKFPICIFLINENEYSALLLECTHKGCELNPNNNHLVCPCHGSEFNNKGVVQNPPAEANLKQFKIKIDENYIYIQL